MKYEISETSLSHVVTLMSCQSLVIFRLLNPKPTQFYHTCRNTYNSVLSSVVFELYLSTVKCNFAMEIKHNY